MVLDGFSQLPEGFNVEPVVEDVESIAGIRFLNDSTSLLWTFGGKVFTMLNDVVGDYPVVNIIYEVGQWGDHGALGFAVHPDFDQNGYIYILFAVDPYHLLNSQTIDYDPYHSEAYDASIGRLSRFQLQTAYPHDLVEGSRVDLIGSDITNGIPQMSASHGVGSLEFGTDKSLLISCGDGSTWVGAFTGGAPYPEYAFDEDGLGLGILRPEENIGSYRAQYTDSYNGKLLRIDPITGLGLESNPFYDPSSPDSPRSKVWSMGLRNPFRFIVRPGTGSSNINEGNPGSVYIGDVGYYNWEEINVANGPALNFGWPQYEGMNTFIGYDTSYTYHPDYNNPLHDIGGCTIERYRFQDLLTQPREGHLNYWGNPCDYLVPIADSLQRFTHERPALSYANQATPHPNDCLVPGFSDSGDASAIPIEEVNSISGEAFTGIASVGGDFYLGTSFPEEYFGAYFQSDYSGWFRVFWFDENDQLIDFKHFSSDLGPILGTRFNPYDECLYITTGFPTAISRICFAGNVKPNAIIEADTIYGPSPLTVVLDGSQSWDANEDPLTFSWTFGDGQSSDLESLSHQFIAPDSSPHMYEVELTVTDTAGNFDTETIIISLNNTPPQVNITSIPAEGALYSTSETTIAALEAEVFDAEFTDDELSYSWQTFQYHDTHFHPNPFDHEHVTSTVFEPAGCEDYATYYYKVALTVTDPAGLSGYDERFIHPDCSDTITNPIPQFSEYVIYPNPNGGNFTLRGTFESEDEVQIGLYGLTGRAILEEKRIVDAYGRLGFSIPGLSPGQYLLRIKDKDSTEVLRLQIMDE